MFKKKLMASALAFAMVVTLMPSGMAVSAANGAEVSQIADTSGFTSAGTNDYIYSGSNWACYFGDWNGTASGSYYGTGNPYKMYVATNTNGAQGAWLVQARYDQSATSGHQYSVSVNVTVDQASTIGMKEDLSNGSTSEPVYTSIGAGSTVNLTGTYTVSQDSIRLAFEMTGVPAGTLVTFNSVTISDLTVPETTTTTTKSTPYAFTGVESEAFDSKSGGVIDTNSTASGGYNLGGLTNGCYMEYDGVIFDGEAGGVLLHYASKSGDAQGNAEIYVDSLSNKVGEIELTNTGTDWSTYADASAQLDTYVSAGTHTVFIKYVTTGSAAYVCNSDYFKFIYSSEYGPQVTISDDIEINGFQISATAKGIRTVYSVDSTVEGQSVAQTGLVYSTDKSADIIVDSTSSNTYSYVSTTAGKMSEAVSKSTSYTMTMTFGAKTAAEYTTTIYIRGYAKLADGSYVYTSILSYSPYSIADKLYKGKMMPNYAFHNYLYTDILTVVNSSYTQVTYDWKNSIAKPEDLT